MFKLGDVISPIGVYLTANNVVEPWMVLRVIQIGSKGVVAEFLGDQSGLEDEFISEQFMHFYKLNDEYAFYRELEKL